MATGWQGSLGYVFGIKCILDFCFCCTDQAFGQKTDKNTSFALAFERRREKGKGFWGMSFGSYNSISVLSISNIH